LLLVLVFPARQAVPGAVVLLRGVLVLFVILCPGKEARACFCVLIFCLSCCYFTIVWLVWHCECMECLGMLVWIRMCGCCMENSNEKLMLSPKQDL